MESCFLAEKISKSKEQKEYTPKILAYDIETTSREIGKGEILMISLYSDDYKKVLTWKGVKDSQDYVENFKNEKQMIESFVSEVNKYDPDILTGYFSDGFDLPFLKSRAVKKKANFSLGIESKGPTFSKGRISSGKISGIVHVDLYRFVSAIFAQYLQSESLSLNEVAKELVGEEKNEFDFSKLSNMKEKDWLDFFSYNIKDAIVTYKLAQKIWPDMFEFTKIIKEPLFDISRDRMATHVENYLIHNLDRFNEIAEKRPSNEEIAKRRSMGKYEGAFVFEPKPGLYEDIVMFDFTSMYASVIVSYNLSKSTLTENGDFSKKEGFFPQLLNEIIDKRKEHKKAYAKNQSGMLRARSNAYKLLANAAYGYQAYFGARYYCREAASATARFARDNIHKAIDIIEKKGYTIIYSDTDSIAFLSNKKSHEEILNLLKEINKDLPGIMELDLEDFYSRGIFVKTRSGEKGAKKKYALITEKGTLKIRGFETVRRDWCNLARKLQSEILKEILKEGSEKKSLEILKKTISNLKEKKIDKKDLIIKTQLKREINDYVAKGPHVEAAKKMQKLGIPLNQGTIIEYYVGKQNSKSKLIRDRVFLASESAEYDPDYYLNNQILPAVESIFEVFNVSVQDLSDGSSQKKLF